MSATTYAPSLRTELIDWMLAQPGTAGRPSQFEPTSPAIWIGRREIAHFHGGREIDLRMTRQAIRAHRAELETDRRVILREGSSDWCVITFARRADLPILQHWIGIALNANRR